MSGTDTLWNTIGVMAFGVLMCRWTLYLVTGQREMREANLKADLASRDRTIATLTAERDALQVALTGTISALNDASARAYDLRVERDTYAKMLPDLDEKLAEQDAELVILASRLPEQPV